MNLPELPKPLVTYYDDIDKEEVHCYSAGQLRAYAEEAVRMERGACEMIAISWSDKSYEAEQIAAEIRSRTAVPVKEGPPHRVTQWGNCSVCRRDRIPGEACARKDCPDAPAAVPVPAKE